MKKRNRRLLLEGLERREVFAVFTAGDLAVLRADTATANSTISVLEVNPTLLNQTTPVQTIAVPNTILIDQNIASNGYLSNSNDGTRIVFSGHQSNSAVKEVGEISRTGIFSSKSTYTSLSGNQTLGAATLNNLAYAATDDGGVYTIGATTASPSASSLRAVKAIGGTLYVGRNAVGAPPVATLSAVTGGTLTNLPGLPNLASASFNDFYLVDSGIAGTYDVLYVLQVNSLSKYSFSGGTWVSNGSVAVGGFSMAAFDLDHSNTLVGADIFITSGDGATSGNSLTAVRDLAGFNQTISVAGSPRTLFTASAGTTLKGVSLAPANTISSSPQVGAQPSNVSITYGANASFSASAVSTPRASVQWQTSSNGTTWTNITSTSDNGIYSGFTTDTLTLTKPPASLSGRLYRAIYSNSAGTDITTSATLTVAAKALTATGTAQSKVYDRTTAATTSVTLVGVVSGETVTATVTGTFSDKNVANGKTVSLTSYVLSGATAANYTVTGNATTTANITALGLTSTATASNKVYDGNVNASVTIGLVGVISGDTVTATGSATFADKNVGTGKTVTVSSVNLAGADSGNYTVSLPATTTADITALQLTATATANNKVYDATTAATVNISLTGALPGDTITGTATGTFANKNVGTGKTVTVGTITLSGTGAGNYSTSTPASPTADISAFQLTATATAADKVYDATTSASVSIGLTGVFSGDTVTGSASGTFGDKNVGNAKTVTLGPVTLAGADAGNYTTSTPSSPTANITPFQLTATATATDKVYDSTTAGAVTIALSGVFLGDTVSGSASGNFADKNVGNNKPVTVGAVTLSGADQGNYTAVVSNSPSANITPFGLTATATASSRAYDATTNASVSISLSGVFLNDVVSGTATGTFANKFVGTNKTVSVSAVTLVGADQANYTVGGTNSPSADITPFALVGSITAANKLFDGTTTATILTRTLSGVFSGDTVSYVGGTANFNTATVGANKPVTATGLSLTGADSANYTVNSSASTTASIQEPVPVVSGTIGINGGQVQRSQLTSLTVNFNTPVTLDPGAIVIGNVGLLAATGIVNLADSQLVFSPSSGPSSTFTITFNTLTAVSAGTVSGGVVKRANGQNSLADGTYQLTIDATKVKNVNNLPMAANYNFGTQQADNFYRMYGDSNGDGVVSGADLTAFRLAVANYNPALDWDGNGSVSTSGPDYTNFTTNYSKRRRTL